jgi:glycerol uptake facilitator-like aquaporin
MGMTNRVGAEILGTFALTFGGCGSAVLAAAWHLEQGPLLGIGFAGVSLAFGLTVLTHGIRRRPYLRCPFQSCSHLWPVGGGTV